MKRRAAVVAVALAGCARGWMPADVHAFPPDLTIHHHLIYLGEVVDTDLTWRCPLENTDVFVDDGGECQRNAVVTARCEGPPCEIRVAPMHRTGPYGRIAVHAVPAAPGKLRVLIDVLQPRGVQETYVGYDGEVAAAPELRFDCRFRDATGAFLPCAQEIPAHSEVHVTAIATGTSVPAPVMRIDGKRPQYIDRGLPHSSDWPDCEPLPSQGSTSSGTRCTLHLGPGRHEIEATIAALPPQRWSITVGVE
jgi:hypothetical protein